MNGRAYGVNWIKNDVHHEIKGTSHMIIDSEDQIDGQFLVNGEDDEVQEEFLINNGDEDGQLDHIAAQNLIFMARDGHISEIIQASTDANGTVIVAAADDGDIDYGVVLQQSDEFEHVQNIEDVDNVHNNVSYVEHYANDYPQMVTEEVITDDWVQHQGEERVEVSEEQIIASSSQVLPEIEVPLPTIQDEYTALRPYPCDFCSRRFKKKVGLMNHLISHQNNRPHLCKLCDSRFFRRSELIHHLQAHAENDSLDPETTEDAPSFDANVPLKKDLYEQEHWSNDVSSNKYNPSATEKAFSQNVENSLTIIAPVRGRISRLKLKEYPILEENHISEANHSSFSYLDNCVEEPTTKKIIKKDSKGHNRTSSQYPVLNDSKPFVCQQCGLAFAREKALLSHSKTHHTVDSQYECNQCSEIFLDEESLQEHQKCHQFEDSNSEFDPKEAEESRSDSDQGQIDTEYYCSHCGIGFHRSDLLKRHLRMHMKQKSSNPVVKNESQKTGQHLCTTCGESFDEALNLLAHAEIHARHPPFKCQLCGEGFYEENVIKRHLQTNHSKEMTAVSCILCGKQCRDRKALMKHAWEHSREKCHTCSKCGKSFHNKARLKRHMSSHRDKSVVCDVCHAEFPDGRSLSNHRHSHSANSNGKLFPCHECGKTFGSRSSQQIHVRIHTGERPYGCRFCWKAFADGGTLRKHERIHTGEKPYACSVCPRAFNQRVVLRDHIRSHHSALDTKRNSYFCTVCSTDLTTSNDLIQHLIEHSDKNTAMHRAPVTGPRKYKRRRKLKPHELAQLQSESKQTDPSSDLDISDFDMDVDDILGITDNTTTTSSSVNKISPHNDEANHFIMDDMSDEEIDVGDVSSTGSASEKNDRDWDPRLMKQSNQTYKNPVNHNFSNFNNDMESFTLERKRGRGKKIESTAQRTQQYTKPDTSSKTAKQKKKTEKQKKTAGPKMIHTEKLLISQNEGSLRRRPKAMITRSETTDINFLTNSTSSIMGDDYDIISPDIEPPNQISSSPLYTKNERPERSRRGKSLVSHDLSASPCNQSQVSSRTNDMFDAQLLLEASSLRKNVFDKFNPGIVNDLEEILGSPLKGDKMERQRFISESSTTQFMTEQSEEEQNLIKIEPTSPDLRDIVPGVIDETIHRRLRRRNNENKRKYIEFDSNSTIENSLNLSPSTLKSSNYETQNSTARTIPIEKTSRNISSKIPSYSAYVLDTFSSSPVNVDSSYFSLSAVVSAADATAAAVEAAATNASSQNRNRRVFECEMCSEVFTDRAQLLDHVHIHI